MIIHRNHRALGIAAGILAAAVACGGGSEPSQAKADNDAAAPPAAKRLTAALLTEGDLTGYRRRGTNSGTLRSLGYQEVFDRLREFDADKPQCLNGYLGGISGPAYQNLQHAPAAMAIFAGSKGSFGQMIVSAPASRAVKALEQPFPAECSNVTAALPEGGTMTMSIREIHVPPLGDQARAFRGKVVVAGKRSVILSETIRAGGYVHNIQLQDGKKHELQRLARLAIRKARQNLV